MKSASKHIAFAWWSSGGHVVPIVSLIKSQPSHQTKSIQLFWFGEKNSMEEKECRKLQQEGYTIQFIPMVSGKIRRKPNMKELLQNTIDLFKVAWWTLQCLWYLRIYHIHVVFCKGGFVSLPVVFAAKILGIRIAVHESDSVAGLSTRIAAKFAEHIFTWFAGVIEGAQNVGPIFSNELFSEVEGRKFDSTLGSTGAKNKKTSVLVNCGSLGSASVHEALLNLFHAHPDLYKEFNWVILLGALNASFRKEYERYSSVVIYDFVDQKQMGALYQEADVSICRGGSTTLFEQQLFGINQIIIPIPWTHDQYKNAEEFVKIHGHVLVDQTKPNRYEDLYRAVVPQQWHIKENVDLKEIAKIAQQRKMIIWDALLI